MIQRREALIAYLSVAAFAAILGCKQQPPISKVVTAPAAATPGDVFAAPDIDDLLRQVPDAGPPPVPTLPPMRMYDGQEPGVCAPLDYAWKAPGCKGTI